MALAEQPLTLAAPPTPQQNRVPVEKPHPGTSSRCSRPLAEWPRIHWRRSHGPSHRSRRDQVVRPGPHASFFGSLFGWKYPTEGAVPGYTFVDTGVPDALYTAISPLQGGDDLVTFFVGVQDIEDTISDTLRLGGRVVQEPATVPGVTFAVIADPLGHAVGLAQQH